MTQAQDNVLIAQNNIINLCNVKGNFICTCVEVRDFKVTRFVNETVRAVAARERDVIAAVRDCICAARARELLAAEGSAQCELILAVVADDANIALEVICSQADRCAVDIIIGQ